MIALTQKRGVRAMTAVSIVKNYQPASLRMSGIENILTLGDLTQYNETDAASEVS
jgi:hypothetical protein